MKIASCLINFSCILLIFMSLACQSSNLYDPDVDLGTNAVNGQAQRTTGFPNYLRPLDVAIKKAEAMKSDEDAVDDVASQAVKPAVATKVELSEFDTIQR